MASCRPSEAGGPTLANFGIVLTGRLGLRNELCARKERPLEPYPKSHLAPPSGQRPFACFESFSRVHLCHLRPCATRAVLLLRGHSLSTFSIGKAHWEERYFVLTKKGLHYYVRQRDSGVTQRDMFGEHEGSIAIGNIARIELPRQRNVNDETDMTFVIVSKNGGRRFVLKAGSEELYDRWVSTLQAAIDPSCGMRSGSGSGLRASGSWTRLATRSGASGSFPRIPTLLDFRSPPRTDNLANVTLFSSVLGMRTRADIAPTHRLPSSICPFRACE
jgi:hypothetical protein